MKLTVINKNTTTTAVAIAILLAITILSSSVAVVVSRAQLYQPTIQSQQLQYPKLLPPLNDPSPAVGGQLPPIANAGHPAGYDQIVNIGQKVVLDGSKSFSRTADDPIIKYQWDQIRGPKVNITSSNSSITSFVAPKVTGDATLKFRLVITDDLGLVDVDYTTMLLRKPTEPPPTPALTVADAKLSVMFPGSTGIMLASSLSDTQGELVKYQIVTQPSHGTLVEITTTPTSVNRALFKYTPSSGTSLTDSFTYKATDNFNRTSNVATVLITIGSVVPPPPPPPPPPIPGNVSFSFGAAGDFGSDNNAAATASAMVNHHIQLFVGEGDYCYCASDGSWWTGSMKTLSQSGIVAKGVEGNHEVEDSHGGNDLAQLWGMSSFKEQSFDYKNTHFLLLPEDSATPDPNFVDKDLAAARANTNIKWIVVVFHEPIYTSGSDHGPDENGIKNTVLPLIDRYHVDLVLQGHNHNYQRMFGMKADQITDRPDASGNYQSPKGTVYMVIGTGGQDNYALKNQASYVVKQFTNDHGFVDFTVTDQKITGTYFSNGGITVKDSFSITH